MDEGTDAYTALAAELGWMGHRLDGMSARLLALRRGEGPPGAVSEQATDGPQEQAGPVAPAAGPTTEWPPPAGRHQQPVHPGWFPVPSTGWPAAAPGAGVRPAPTGMPPMPQQVLAHPPGPGRWPAAGSRSSPGAQSPPGVQPAPGSQPPPGWRPPPGSAARGFPPPPRPDEPADPHPGRASSALTGARLLAWTGGAVTLLGVVLLLALAASRGWFTPALRLAGGGLLGVVLVGIGLRLHRNEAARIGATALAATGFAALYLTVAAATSLYDYLPSPVALLLALGVAGAGLGVADRWRSELLAGGVTVGAAVSAPVLAGGWLLVALVLALQLAVLPVVLRRAWSVLLLLAAAAPALYGVFVLVDEQRAVAVVGPAAAAAAVGLGTVLAARTGRPGARAAVVAGAALPGLIGAGSLGGVPGTVTALLLAAVFGAFAYVPGLPVPVRVAAGVTAVLAVQFAVATGLQAPGRTTIALLGEALVAAALAAVLRSRFAIVTGLVLGGIGLLATLTREATPGALARLGGGAYLVDGIPQIGALVTGIVVSMLVLATAAVLLVATGRRGWTRPDAASAGVWVPLGLAGLYGAASLVMALALLVSPTPDGFRAGHVVITVSWTVAALVLLAQGLRRPALRIAGLVLVAAAVAKLVLFDLVALDGLARVVAFLAAGLVLLAAGTRYARMVAQAEQDGTGEPVVADAPATPAGRPVPAPDEPPIG